MKKIVLQTTFKVYTDSKQLAPADQQLLALAKNALEDSYSPYSQFQVGAGLLLQNGEMLSGSNQENAAYPMCLCAERVALGAAAAQYPKEAILAIAITAKNPRLPQKRPVSPCGACRQVLVETEAKHNQTMRIILQGEVGDIYLIDQARDLLPLSFDGGFLF